MFFAISGIWQRLKLHLSNETLALISTIHTSRPLKAPGTERLISPLIDALVIAMALGLIATTVIGVVMAFRFGRKPSGVVAVLVSGTVLPFGLLLIAWFS